MDPESLILTWTMSRLMLNPWTVQGFESNSRSGRNIWRQNVSCESTFGSEKTGENVNESIRTAANVTSRKPNGGQFRHYTWYSVVNFTVISLPVILKIIFVVHYSDINII